MSSSSLRSLQKRSSESRSESRVIP
uniref:Uncharacterized protein n=1 Tax=Anguilla anguilla TaxID=7936 RepID=A0A0E9VEM5_ANGAN